MNRVFLDWDGGLLAKAATWLVEEFGGDMRGVVVALPSAQAGRTLQELLARARGAGFQPPRVVTAGALSDALLDVIGAAAGRLVRTLAWQRALQDLPGDQLAMVVARPPERGDHAAWTTLAEEVRGLFGEIAAEGLDFAAVAESSVLEILPGEVQRWRALSSAQERMARLLSELGLHDPHLGRLAAILAGRLRKPRHVVLVGVTLMNELLRRTLDRCQSPETALVFAPEGEQNRFDDHGCLLAEAWTTRQTSLTMAAWQVVGRPEDQARAVARAIAGWHGAYRAEEISIGIADGEVSPYIKGRLAESGIRARDAAGIPMARTAAVRLLTAVGAFLRSSSYIDLAVLVRHPDFESALLRTEHRLEPIDILDDYQREHLPWRVDADWSADPHNEHDLALRQKMTEVWAAAREVLGDLRDARPVPIGEQAEALRRFLTRIYGVREFDRTEEEGRVSIVSLGCLAQGLSEIEDLPESLAPEGSMSDAIEMLLRIASDRSHDIPPSPARVGEPTIEMMGWFELPLDDAPSLIVTGFQDGKVPESVRGDAYLPNRLRRDLGIVDNQERLARDLYATEVLVHSRKQVLFLSGRRNLAGDPLVPSRVVFHCPDDDVAPRVRRFLAGRSAPAARPRSSDVARRELPRGAEVKTPEVISVSAFKTFLESPYAYYLRYVLKLDTQGDSDREMDAAAFGNLVHAVLQRFGEDRRARGEQDEEKIAAFLSGTLEEMGREIYGPRPLPTVHLQLAQMKLRLRCFAALQAKRRREGWRIHAVEWEPEGGSVDLVVDGAPIRLRGRIDRIDFHETRKVWAIWDYKAGNTPKKPLTAHRRSDGRWIDLQLPLYSLMTTALFDGGKLEELGYIAIGRDDKSRGFWNVKDWRKPRDECDNSAEALSGGIECAREVVRKIRAGEFFVVDGWQPYEEILAAIGGVGLLGAPLDQEEEAP